MDMGNLPDDPAALKGVITDLLADHAVHVSQLEERIRLLQAMIYGPRSEKKPPLDEQQSQLPLFDEAEKTVAEEQTQAAIDVIIPGHARKKPGRRALPADLPRVEVIHDLPEQEKTCACGCTLTRIGEEVSEKLDIVPAKVQVIRHVRYKYACRGCEGVESQGGAVKLAPLPPQIIPQGIVTPALLAHILVAKFSDALPFYRQENQFKRLGIDLSRSTMANWAILAARICAPLVDLLKAEIRSGPVINMDETTVQVLSEPGRANTTKSYMWLFRGGAPDRPAVLFQYEPTRAGKVAQEFIGEYQGYIQTDGYLGYEALGSRPGICHIGCMAHVRRKFMEVLKAGGKKDGTAKQAVDLIAKLYAIEKRAREGGLSYAEVKALRDVEAKPVLDKLKSLLDARIQTTPPKSLLGKALNYASNQWERVVRYLEDGRLKPDNNLAENAIRPFAVGRKNWLFSGHPRGATASATIYSLIETAKANCWDPFSYLTVLFEELPKARSVKAQRALLPQYLDLERLA